MQQNYSINQIKLLWSLWIIFIHLFSNYQILWLNYDLWYFLDNIFRFAVPSFFAFSWIIMWQKFLNHNFWYFLKYIFSLIFLHLVVWLFYYFSLNLFEINTFGDFFVKDFSIKFFVEWFYYHLWFIPALMIWVILLYIWVKLKKEKLFFWISFILHLIWFFWKYEIFSMFWEKFIEFNWRTWLFFWFFYVMLGNFIYKKNYKQNTKLYLFLAILFIVLQYFEHIFFYNIFWSSDFCNFYISTIFALIFLVNLVKSNINLLPKLNDYTFLSQYIYFCHPLIIYIIIFYLGKAW